MSVSGRPHNQANSQAPQDAEGHASFSLQRLKKAFAELLGKDDENAHAAAEQSSSDSARAEAGDISPRNILEAMLFVGNENNSPLTSAQVAELVRGVEPQEVDELVVQLNQLYDKEGCPYRIVHVNNGYRLELRAKFHRLRDRFYGRIRRARLSQVAIDVLAIVAYNQPVSRREVDRLRRKPSGALLSQLVRRKLLELQRRNDSENTPCYFTTNRFLALFHLESLDELPQSEDFEKRL